MSIQALLSAPNPDDPLANDVAEKWKTNESQAIETGIKTLFYNDDYIIVMLCTVYDDDYSSDDNDGSDNNTIYIIILMHFDINRKQSILSKFLLDL